MVEVPRKIACACCGKPLHCLDSFAVSVPRKSKVEVADLCSLSCLATWAGTTEAALNPKVQA